jgi:hypothetical protein
MDRAIRRPNAGGISAEYGGEMTSTEIQRPRATQRMESREQIAGAPALAVDLDGTLVKTDLLLESIIALLKRGPWCLFILPF